MANQCFAKLNLVITVYQIHMPSFTLSWSHYLILMRVENPDARSFYEIECAGGRQHLCYPISTYLPDKNLLQEKVKNWIKEYKEENPDEDE